jgi:hypothetical protein
MSEANGSGKDRIEVSVTVNAGLDRNSASHAVPPLVTFGWPCAEASS